ncbi:MAG TPA: GIY-YIG nuclease family protein [Rhizomicrobium sp.]|nr:GIY-YIG nuclease family protein [Rhizomicrobium sp.]
MDKSRRKELAREYKEQKARPAVFAVRCTATGEVWVARAPEPEKKHTSLWFQLRLGGFPNKEMQAAWNAHGEASFAFEILEEIEDENEQMIPVLLKDREAYWRKQLNAGTLV